MISPTNESLMPQENKKEEQRQPVLKMIQLNLGSREEKKYKKVNLNLLLVSTEVFQVFAWFAKMLLWVEQRKINALAFDSHLFVTSRVFVI